MESPCPPHWTFAARAAYFGDRMCAFCDHRNPADAKFCNDCAAPLHLKPCKQCDAVNEQAATNCRKCGASCPVPVHRPEATPASAAADVAPASATPDGAGAAATVTQPAASAQRAGWRVLTPGQFLLAALATALIVAAYDAYRVAVVTRDATEMPSQSAGPAENKPAPTLLAAPTTPAPMAAVPDSGPALQAPVPATAAEAPKPESVPQHAAAVPDAKLANARERTVDTKRASAGPRAAPKRRQASAGTNPSSAHHLSVARVAVGVPARSAQNNSQALRPQPWQMQASLARCGGDLIARIACDQRVRRRFCAGHWGEAPECPRGIANDHGQ